MKLTTILALILCSSAVANAQLDLKKAASTATSTATALGFDPAKIGKSIMDTVTPKLGLSADATTKVSGLVNQFLTTKSSFVGTAQTAPADYKTKLEADQKTLFSGLKSTLTPTQMTQFMGLKPAQSDATNAVSQLFY